MKKRIFLALIILIAFMSVGIISASEISVNDTYVAQDSSENLLAVDEGGVGSNSSNILSINDVDTNLDENTIGDDGNFTNDVKIKASDLSLYYKNGTRLTAQLVDRFDNGLAGQSMEFDISGVKYTKTTDSQGYASIAINLLPGNYPVGIYYNGLSYPVENRVNCTVLPTISGDDMVKYYKNGTQYYAAFLKGDGTPLADTNVTFNINGVMYVRTTNTSGVARLNINLPPQDYILTAIHPESGYMYSNNVTVLPTIISKDLYKVYKDNNQYYATFLTGEGNPLADTNVTFNINGVMYVRTTNASGVARLNINLLAGEYILTAMHPYDTYMLSNKVYIISSSGTSLGTNDYIYNMDDKQIIEVQLFNDYGYGIPNQVINITAGNTTTTATTNDDGIASVTLNINPGEYIVRYIYPGDGTGKYKASTGTSALTIKEGKTVYMVEGESHLYYGKGEKFNISLCDENYNPLVNMPVYFRIDNGILYTRYTDENGTAGLTINMNPGVYTMNYKFNATGYQHIDSSCELLVIDGNTSTLTGENITVGQGAGEKFYVSLSVGDVGLPNRNVTININGVNYTRITDDDGIAAITINLNAGNYLVKYYYDGEDRIEPSHGEAYVIVKERIATSLKWSASTTFVDESNINLIVTLLDKDNKPISNKTVFFGIGSRTYPADTDKNGLALINVSLTPGSYLISYEFDGDGDYLGSIGTTQISIADSHNSHGYGYWAFGKDMKSIDLVKFATLGTSDIFLNFYAFELYGESDVLSWIESANANGINVHIWMQVFYSGGSWVNPVSGGSNNQAYFNTVINEAKYYAGLKGVAGVHFDYLRYPGTAYNTPGGTAAVTEFARQASEACRAINPNIIMSAAVMPETTNDIYYYGQDIPALSKILDVLVPMQYKGNYKTGTNWLASTTEWFVKNSQGAEIWSGLQSYVSDDNPTKLTYTELFGDAQTVVDNGADGVILFRYGLSQFLDFNDLEDPAYGDTVTMTDILGGAAEMKNYIETEGCLPSKLAVGTSYHDTPQILYLMAQATLMLNGNIPQSDVVAIRVTSPNNSTGNDIYDSLSLNQYISFAQDISAYCSKYNQAPYAMSTSSGDVSYNELVYIYSRILYFYMDNGRLPANAYIGVFLEKPNLTVNMMPSSSHTEGYKYINYTTTWLNYCPQCDHYGVLLVNPKHTHEGELTCAYCDCDYCGVTGYEKIKGSDYILTRLSESVPITPGGDGDVISIASIIDGASNLAAYFAENENFPEYVVVEEGKYTMPQFLYLMSKAISQIDAGNFAPITMIKMDDPSNSGDVIDGYLTREQYVDVLSRAYKFIESRSVVPAYSSSTLGRISYPELIDMSSRILDYYGDNGQLPTSIHVISISPSSKSISDLAKSLVAGLTSDRQKATALFNYVRDQITYEFYYDTQKGAEGTLIAGGGNCCDQAQLLVALGRSVGLTVRFDTGYCYFPLSGATYGHVWTQFLIDGTWVNADPTSTRNSFGEIVNWNTASYTDRGTYDILPY